MDSHFLQMQNTIYTKWTELDDADIIKPFKTFSLTKTKEELETIETKSDKKSDNADKDQKMKDFDNHLSNMFEKVSKDMKLIKSKKKMNSLVFDSENEKIYFSFEKIPKTFIYCTKEDKLLGKPQLQQNLF